MPNAGNAGSSTPIGCVLAYAGCLNDNELNLAGWWVCDGAALEPGEYPDLFGAIGTCNGGDGAKSFNLPDYRGRFLRGLDTTGRVDKGAAERAAAASGGATGATVGSVEDCATALPNEPFVADLPHVPDGQNEAYYGTNADMLKPGGPTVVSSSGGGDSETRPVNAYVRFIVKAANDALIPAGAIVPFAGNDASGSPTLQASYRLCDGASLAQEQAPELFAALGTAHGGAGDQFNLPDYRGRFLRGLDDGAGRDPDSAARRAMADGGAAGDAVGSIQGYATAPPTQPFVVTIDLGDSDKESTVCAGHHNAQWNPDAVSVSFTASGGDRETRPLNVAVDHYVLSRPEDGDADVFPIGGVIAFAGDAAPPDGAWALCDGSSVPRAGQYEALYRAIGCANGGAQESFDLPDYRGWFLRGTDRGQGRDPDAAARTEARPGGEQGDNVGSAQGCATARPVRGDITGEVSHLPTEDASNALAIWAGHVAGAGGTSTPAVGGGDDETRPLNVTVAYYVKYAPEGGSA